MLETIRRNTFETNSSSCHSVTTMPTDLWTQFKNHEVVFKKSEWDIECHTSISTVLNEDNIKYVAIPFDKYYQSFHSALLKGKDESIKKFTLDPYYNLEAYVYDWVCKNITKEKFLKWLTNFKNDDECYDTIENQISVKYQWNDKETIYDKVKQYMVYDIIHYVAENYMSDYSYRIPYVYGDDNGWEGATVYGDEPKTVDIEILTHYVTDDIKIKTKDVTFDILDNNTIRIYLNGTSKVVVERDEEC